jgi:RNA polymerase sigma-70 factor (ECF subfamily)
VAQRYKMMAVYNTPMADSISKTDYTQFIKDLRRRDPSAVTELYNTYADRIYSLVFHQVDRNHEVAQDIVQETFVAALKSAAKFRNQSKVYTWLCSIANNKVSDFYRRQKRQAKYQTSKALEPDQISIGALSPEPVESTERQEMAKQVLFSLPLHYRQVLILKYVEEMSVLKIGKIMGRSPKSIEGLLTRARKELRAKLATPSEG